jgi:hypothetical protein
VIVSKGVKVALRKPHPNATGRSSTTDGRSFGASRLRLTSGVFGLRGDGWWEKGERI